MDQDQISSLLEEFCRHYGFPLQSVDVQERDTKNWYINIVPEQHAAAMIGRNGDHLLALQHVLKNLFKTQGLLAEDERMKIDIDSYRLKQESNVRSMADDRAKDVLSTGQAVTMPPMSSFFRRLVHLHIKQNYPELTTFSQGDRNHRAVCISPEGGEAPDTVSSAPADLYAELDF